MDVKGPNLDRFKDRTQRDMDKLKRDIDHSIINSIDHILDISEVAIGDPQRYKSFRSKVLRAANDSIRDIKRILDSNYQVVYVSTSEDIIQVQVPTVTTIKHII